MMRQILDSLAEYEKARLVAKLTVALDRKKAETGKRGGALTHRPALRLSRSPMNFVGSACRYLRIFAGPASRGLTTATGRPYVASAIERCLATERRRWPLRNLTKPTE
jgi:hypothetical protein